MLYKKSHSVETGTSGTSPDTKTIKISKGILNLWVVWMTVESGNYLNLRIFYHGVQVYPFTPQEEIKGWFVPIGVSDNLKIDTPPYELTVEAWNTAPTNSHEYHVHVNVEPKTAVRPVETELTIPERIMDFFRGA